MTEPEERRTNPTPFDVTGIIAVLYTVGFLTLASMLYFFPIPPSNKDALLYLFGILSGVQLSIIAYLFGSSKSGEASQRAVEQSKIKSEAAIQEIAKAQPSVVTVPAVAPSPPAQPIQAENVSVEANTATLTEVAK